MFSLSGDSAKWNNLDTSAHPPGFAESSDWHTMISSFNNKHHSMPYLYSCTVASTLLCMAQVGEGGGASVSDSG